MPKRGSIILFLTTLSAIAILAFTVDSSPPLLPPLVALACLSLSRSAGLSLFVGSLFGVLLIGNGPAYLSPMRWVNSHLWPALTSSWHWSALAFTLLLAAFAAIVERSGALARLLQTWSRSGTASPASRFQVSIVGLGLLCFFDGLANALMLGRVGRTLADQARVSREKLAYLVDTTSSAVACVAFISTWSVFQLSLISEELAEAPFTTPAYVLFLQSIPTNFYCLSSLLLAFLAARWNWNPAPMNRTVPQPIDNDAEDFVANSPLPFRAAFGPIAVLLLSVPLSFWILGGQKLLPSSLDDIQKAFATDLGPYALLLAGLFSILGAIAFFPKEKGTEKALAAIPRGVGSVAPALIVLIMAWTLGSTLRELGTGTYLANLLADHFPIHFLPLLTFLLGCLIAFSTGTSWGTMALLMPLALGTFLSAISEQNIPPSEVSHLLPPIIAAVFGGAVFGDHASPFSDTTIVSALACDVTTTTHVATQLPYALLAASFSILFGYLPIGLGLSPGLSAPLPLIITFLFVLIARRHGASTHSSAHKN